MLTDSFVPSVTKPPSIKKSVKKSIWVSVPQDLTLKAVEKLTGLSQSEHMRRALDEYFAKLEKEGKL